LSTEIRTVYRRKTVQVPPETHDKAAHIGHTGQSMGHNITVAVDHYMDCPLVKNASVKATKEEDE